MAGFSVSMLIFIALFIINYHKINKWDKKFIVALILLICLVFGIIWEAGEYALDVKLKTHYSLGAWDTSLDLLSDMMGALIVAIYAYILLSNASYKDINGKIIKVNWERFRARLRRIDESSAKENANN